MRLTVRAGVALALLCSFDAPQASAHDLLRSTYFLGIRQGSELSDIVRRASRGGYELSNGTFQSFERWYGRDWIDVRIDFMTQLNENFGILWGVSTGERGEKFTIDPALKLGFIVQMQPTPSSTLSFSASTLIGGRLDEKSCVADYGQIGGVQEVNCRLAASILPPRETLGYLWGMKPPDHTRLGFKYVVRF